MQRPSSIIEESKSTVRPVTQQKNFLAINKQKVLAASNSSQRLSKVNGPIINQNSSKILSQTLKDPISS